MQDVIGVEGHGFDTVRATFRVLDAIPATDSEFQNEIMASGFRRQCQDWIEDGERVRSERFTYQDSDRPTLGFQLRGGEYLTTEFSAPRLLEDSPANLHLADSDQVDELLEFAGNYGRQLIPGAPELALHKYNRLDYACDLATGDKLPGVISAAAQFRFPNARKTSTHVYPGETATTRSSQRTFRCYDKGTELLHKLSPADREVHRRTIDVLKSKGVTRMELMDRTKGGLSRDSLAHGAVGFAERLETGLSGGVVTIGGLAQLEAQITSLGLSSQRESTLLKFATRYALLGEDGMKARYTKRTFYRHKRMFLEYGLRLDDVCTYSGEIDFRPVFKVLRSAA